ncbi:hypothetical protein AHF37_05693 [Paragonimus kellicotti]|nr:hypothetical protein AHF37_05693 [Paragonimus kellicotti]
MAEQWSETNYATVLRQYPSRRLLKSKYGSGVKTAVDNRLPTEDLCGNKLTSERNHSIQKVTSWVDQVSHTDVSHSLSAGLAMYNQSGSEVHYE